MFQLTLFREERELSEFQERTAKKGVLAPACLHKSVARVNFAQRLTLEADNRLEVRCYFCRFTERFFLPPLVNLASSHARLNFGPFYLSFPPFFFPAASSGRVTALEVSEMFSFSRLGQAPRCKRAPK